MQLTPSPDLDMAYQSSSQGPDRPSPIAVWPAPLLKQEPVLEALE